MPNIDTEQIFCYNYLISDRYLKTTSKFNLRNYCSHKIKILGSKRNFWLQKMMIKSFHSGRLVTNKCLRRQSVDSNGQTVKESDFVRQIIGQIWRNGLYFNHPRFQTWLMTVSLSQYSCPVRDRLPLDELKNQVIRNNTRITLLWLVCT